MWELKMNLSRTNWDRSIISFSPFLVMKTRQNRSNHPSGNRPIVYLMLQELIGSVSLKSHSHTHMANSNLFCVQLAQRKIRDILTQVKQSQKGGMSPGPNPQGFTEMGSPTQGLSQDHQPRRKWGALNPPEPPWAHPPPDGQTDETHARTDRRTDRRIQENDTRTQQKIGRILQREEYAH